MVTEAEKSQRLQWGARGQRSRRGTAQRSLQPEDGAVPCRGWQVRDPRRAVLQLRRGQERPVPAPTGRPTTCLSLGRGSAFLCSHTQAGWTRPPPPERAVCFIQSPDSLGNHPTAPPRHRGLFTHYCSQLADTGVTRPGLHGHEEK